jgi:hypothetical protein
MMAPHMAGAELLFSGELAAGTLDASALDRPEVRAAATRPIPGWLRRAVDRARVRLGTLDYAAASAPLIHARRSVLGDRAAAPPRFLLRVDEFPHVDSFDAGGPYGPAAFHRFHSIVAAAGIPYLLAVCPTVSDDPLDRGGDGCRALNGQEIDLLVSVRSDDVEFGLHGYSHRTRRRGARRRSELAGLRPASLRDLLARAMDRLRELEIDPRVFVPPFNHFGRDQYGTLAERFDVVCGGPETVAEMGFQPTPTWRAGAAFLPAYPPLYGLARDMLPAVRELVAARTGLWTPLVLHWSWESDTGWGALEALLEQIAPYTRAWGEFIDAVPSSHAGPVSRGRTEPLG